MRPRDFFIFLCLMTVALPLSLLHGQGNVIVNGNFENGGGSLNAWTAGGDPGFPVNYAAEPGVQTNGAGINHFALINGNAAFPLVQNVATVPGFYYCLSLSLISFSGTNSCDVSAGNLSTTLQFQATPFQINYWTTANTNWENFSLIFEATATNTAVSIFYRAQVLALTNSPPMTLYYGEGGLDSISVTPAPEPGTWLLLGVGSLLLAANRCRRRNP